MIIKGLVIILLLCEQSFQNPLSPPKLDAVHSTSIPPPLVITNPEEGKDLSSYFTNIWENRFSALSENQRSKEEPKTVLAVPSSIMSNLIPMDAPHPLYDPDYAYLTDRFILESLSKEDINFDDPKLLTPEGFTIKTMNGKDLTFKKDFSTGKIQVNGIDVLKHTKVNGNTNLIVICGFLFNIYNDVQAAVKQLSKTYINPLSPPRRPTIPAVPKVLEGKEYVRADASGLLNIWENRLSKIDPMSIRNSVTEEPKTVLAVDYSKMSNLVPMDAPHPLYSSKFGDLTDRFILQSLSTEDINFDDLKLLTPEGLTIKTMNGKDLTFKKDGSTGKIQVNGIDVLRHTKVNGNTNLIVICGFLFDIYIYVQAAVKQLQKTYINPLAPPSRPTIPAVPKVLEGTEYVGIDTSGLLNIWKNRLRKFDPKSTSSSAGEEPKTVLAVDYSKMSNLVPMDAPHPLYDPDYAYLTDRFILESLSKEDINFDDPKLLTPEGLTIKTMNGKDLTFKKDVSTGRIQVNGIDVLRHTKINGNTNLISICGFLFNIYNDVQEAMKMSQKTYINPLWPVRPSPNTIPALPKVLEGTEYIGIDASGLLNLWKNRLRNLDPTRNSIGKAPYTIVAVDFWKMTNLIPQDAPNPLYSEEYEYLADRFIKDSVSSQAIYLDDPTLLSENGISYRSMSGRDLTFKKDQKTNKLTINDIEVENYKTFEDRTTVFVISDFLFDHQSAVRSAFDELSKKRSQQPRNGPFFG